MEKFNKKLALWITARVSTMTCAYIFAIIAFVSLPSAIESHSVLVITSWLAQTFLQLVLLSIIMVGQSAQAEASDRRMEAMILHISQDNDRILKEVTEILKIGNK
jgi:hypothetical protein